MDIGQLLSIGLALWRSGAHEACRLGPNSRGANGYGACINVFLCSGLAFLYLCDDYCLKLLCKTAFTHDLFGE